MDRDPSIFIVEHRDELEASTQRFEIIPQRRDAHVFGMFELGHRALRDLQATRHLGLAQRLSMAKLIETDLLQRRSPRQQ